MALPDAASVNVALRLAVVAVGGVALGLSAFMLLNHAVDAPAPASTASLTLPRPDSTNAAPPLLPKPVVPEPPKAPALPNAPTRSKTTAPPKAAEPPTVSATARKALPDPERYTGVELIIPVQGIRASQLRDTYSDARGSGRRHDAIDIMAPHGTPVIAAAPATVVKRDNGARGGIALYALAADNHTVYYYAHLDRYAEGVVEGKTLRAGDIIGYVGNTGNAGPGNYHLHFEITTTSDPKRYWGGTPHNPYPILQRGVTQQ